MVDGEYFVTLGVIMLSNETIKLRAVEPEDVDLLERWENDTELWASTETIAPYSRYMLREYVATCSNDVWALHEQRFIIERKDTGAPVGCIDLVNVNAISRRAEVCILIDEKYRGQQLAHQSLTLLIEYATLHLGLHQLYCYVRTDNETSQRVFADAGFAVVGIFKDWLWREGAFHDVTLMQRVL